MPGHPPVDALVAQVVGQVPLAAAGQERIQVLLELGLAADAQRRPPARLCPRAIKIGYFDTSSVDMSLPAQVAS